MTIGKTIRMTAPMLAFALALGLGGIVQAATGTSTETKTNRTKLPGYSSLDAARSACGADTVVWRARDSRVFHGAASKYFGRTKDGAYVCEKAALADHLRPSKY